MASLPVFSPSQTSTTQNDGLSTALQRHIKETFWPQSTSSLAEFTSYFRYLQWTVSILSYGDSTNGRGDFATQTYNDIAKVVRCMEKNRNEARTTIAKEVGKDLKGCTEDQILRSMDLIVRMWLTLHVRSHDCPIGPSLSHITPMNWGRRTSLNQFVSSSFPRVSRGMNLGNSRESRIDPGFTAMNLRKICRVNVKWTSNLRDHLAYDMSTRRLWVYPHKVCLINHLDRCQIFPTEFLQETIRTLDLLFPFGEVDTERWLESSRQPFHRSSSNFKPRATDLAEFQYWRKPLVELYDVYQQPPKTMLQMWHDRRNPMQWWTFWLAALIAILTILFGVISAYTSFQQTDLAEKSYQVAVEQLEMQKAIMTRANVGF